MSIQLCTCTHHQLMNYDDNFYCLKCGSYQPKDGQKILKQQRMMFPALTNPQIMLSAQQYKALKCDYQNSEYLRERNNIIDNMLSWTEKLQLSSNTFFLAVQFLDYFMSKKWVDCLQYQLYGATALMLAAKSIELDMKIPSISQLRKQTCLPFLTVEFRACERYLIKELGWQFQKTTLLDWIESMQSIGIIFDGDQLEREVLGEKTTNYIFKQNSMNLQQLINNLTSKSDAALANKEIKNIKDLSNYRKSELFSKIELITKSLVYLILKDYNLLTNDPQILTLSTISYIRKLAGLKEGIPKQLSLIFPNIQVAQLIDLTNTIPQAEVFKNQKFFTQCNTSRQFTASSFENYTSNLIQRQSILQKNSSQLLY